MRWRWIGLGLAGLLLAGGAQAAELTVSVTGIASAQGEIGCNLFNDPKQFPNADGGMAGQWVKAAPPGATCRFTNIAPGRYAVAVFQDVNGNHRLDTNWLGIPSEPWGVSNNVRPTLRAPSFDEAAFTAAADRPTQIGVEIGP